MPDASPSELRWLLGKIIHCAINAASIWEFETWMEEVVAPEELMLAIDDDVCDDPSHEAAHVAFLAACRLYGHGSQEEARAHETIRLAFTRLWELTEGKAETAETPASPETGGASDTAEVAVDPAQPANISPETVDQTVAVGRDVNAPIVNAPGGHVVINDHSGEADKLLHDYLTLLIYVSFGVKLPDVVDAVRPVVEDAMSSLVAYHAKTDVTGMGRNPELMRDAPAVLDKVDLACRSVFGLGFHESRPELAQLPAPSFAMFEDMLLVKGGLDVFTGQTVRPFYMSRYPVTVSQYAEFCQRMNYPPIPEWETMAPAPGLANHPVTGMTLFDTVMYCVWLELATGFRFRVVTEAEWCFAATGGRRRRYPWGDEYEVGRATTQLESPSGTQPVDAHPDGIAPSGAMDLIGNVWELTSSLFEEDVHAPNRSFTFPPMMFALARSQWWETDRRIPRGAGPWPEAARFVMRGGSFGGGPEWASMDQRIWTSAFNRGAYGGFRIACSAEPVGEGFVPTPSYLASGIGAVADRIQLAAKDGGEALTQKHFSVCGSGSIWQGQLRGGLIESALARWEPADRDADREPPELFGTRSAWMASTSGFPRLRPRTHASESAPRVRADDDVEHRCRSRLADESWQALAAARSHAASAGDDVVRTDHLLVGLSTVEDSFLASVLTALRLHRKADSNATSTGPPLRLTPGAERVLDIVADPAEDRQRVLGMYPAEMLTRLVKFQDDDSELILGAVSVTDELLQETMAAVRIGEGLLRGGGAVPAAKDIEASIAVFRRIEARAADLALGALSGLLTARVYHLVGSGAREEAIATAEGEARKYRERFLVGAEDRVPRGWLPFLQHRFEQLFSAQCLREAIHVLDEVVTIAGREDDLESQLALARALINRALVLFKSGDAAAALRSNEPAIPVLRRAIRKEGGFLRASHLLVLALSNHAEYQLKAGDADAALGVTLQALSVGLPLLSTQRPDLGPGFLPAENLRETAHLCYEAIGQRLDPAVVQYLDAAVREDTNMSELPRPLIPPVPLDHVTSDDEVKEFCSFCGQQAEILGLLGSICAPCVELASQVFTERKVADPESASAGYAVRCCLCGWSFFERRLVVSGTDGVMCGDCQERAVALLA